jgi:spindle assembly abnormal protein 6
LKSAQNLLVDFTAFPEKLIDLLNSTFTIQLVIDVEKPMLRIVETNSFKHITHIELVLTKASDASIKKYLADLVTKGIEEYTVLSTSSTTNITGLEKCKGDNTAEISTLVANVDDLTRQIQDVKILHGAELTRVNEESKCRLDDSIRQKDSESRHAEIKHSEEVQIHALITLDPQHLSTINSRSNFTLASITPLSISTGNPTRQR